MYKGSENAANDVLNAQVTNHGVLKYPFALNVYVLFFYMGFYGNVILPPATTFHHYTM